MLATAPPAGEILAAPMHELALWSLFLEADVVVKGVMVALALASLGCWAVIFEKIFEIARLRRQTRRLELELAQGRRVPSRSGLSGLPAAIVETGVLEWQDEAGAESRSERRQRIERAMQGRLGDGLRHVEVGLPFLATVGSAAPFIGLFGTVWGIMTSFTAIASSSDTSLAVVAPGIAEALFATAMGLVAAIPAVVAYNKLVTGLARVSHRLTSAIAALGSRLSADPPAASLRAAE